MKDEVFKGVDSKGNHYIGSGIRFEEGKPLLLWHGKWIEVEYWDEMPVLSVLDTMKNDKAKLEKDIAELVNAFQTKYDVRVSLITNDYVANGKETPYHTEFKVDIDI